MKSYLPYNKTLKQFSHDLRNHSTLGEILLWQKLRARSMMGYQFDRQKPLENFIVDFYCQALKLVIEIDGGYHNNKEVHENDLLREAELKNWRLNFLRFGEMEVRTQIQNVLLSIEAYVHVFESTHPDCLAHKVRKVKPMEANPPTTFPKE
ncbi:MAG: hypothetical protein JWR72_1140 [Flavisolibacter sp.]|nr:hypothetical protein [Flavisolibacter sp.]